METIRTITLIFDTLRKVARSLLLHRVLPMSRSPAPQSSNSLLLRRQLTELTKRPVEGFSAGTGNVP